MISLRTALALGRVSNLPTVTSNVLAAVALSGRTPHWAAVVGLCVAMSLMYVAGMFLNDAFDRTIDAVERPERPIPSGKVSAAEVFAAGFALLAFGVLGVAGVAVTVGAGWRPIGSAMVLAALIVFYDMHHKRNPFAPVVMGLCRVGVYTTAVFAAGGGLSDSVLVGCGALLAYLIGLTFVARQENLLRLTSVWPLGLLAVPFVVALPRGDAPWTFALWLMLLLWTVRCVRLVIGRQIRVAVGGLIAGISLVDGLLIAVHGPLVMAWIAVVAFGVTTMLQRRIAGT